MTAPRPESPVFSAFRATPRDEIVEGIDRLVTAAEQAGREIERGQGSSANAPVEAARRALYERLAKHGLDGTGWLPEPPTREEYAALELERDRAIGVVDELNATILDLHQRLEHERERADRAEARLMEAMVG